MSEDEATPARRPPLRLGPDEVVARLVEAGTELFARSGPDAVSLREVAAAAGVNHGLIHRYVGSKSDLLRLIFDHATSDAMAAVAGVSDPTRALERLDYLPRVQSDWVRLLCWILLTGRTEVMDMEHPYPLETVVAQAAGDEDAVRQQLANDILMMLAEEIFGDYVRAAVGLDPEHPSPHNPSEQ